MSRKDCLVSVITGHSCFILQLVQDPRSSAVIESDHESPRASYPTIVDGNCQGAHTEQLESPINLLGMPTCVEHDLGGALRQLRRMLLDVLLFSSWFGTHIARDSLLNAMRKRRWKAQELNEIYRPECAGSS